MSQESQKFASELAAVQQKAARAAAEQSGQSHAPSIRELGEGLVKLAALMDVLNRHIQALEGKHRPCPEMAALALKTERVAIAEFIRAWPDQIAGRERIIEAILARC